MRANWVVFELGSKVKPCWIDRVHVAPLFVWLCRYESHGNEVTNRVASAAFALPHSAAVTQHHERAMLLMIAATLLLPSIDAIAKYLSASIGAGQVTWSRFLFQSLFMLPLAWRVWGRSPSPNLLVNALRGVLLAGATLLFFAALKYLPIADAISIFFIEPLLLTLLSALLLGEQVGWRRVSAVLVGLGGAALVIQPNFANAGTPALYPLGAATCFAFYLVLTRKFAQREAPELMQFLAGLAGLAVMSLALAVGTQIDVPTLNVATPTHAQWSWLALLGLIATIGHLLMVAAFARANASLLAPFQYVELVSATILGFVVFGDFPEPATWLGVAVIVGSGLYVFHRERVVKQ